MAKVTDDVEQQVATMFIFYEGYADFLVRHQQENITRTTTSIHDSNHVP